MAIPQYFRATRKIFLYQLLFQLGFFAAGTVLVLLMNHFFNDDPSYACLGTLLSLCGILVGSGIQASNLYFRLTILMGQTRRHYLLWSPLLSVLLTLQGWLTAFCLYRLELLLYGVLYPDFSNDLPVGQVFAWQVLVLSMVLISIILLFLSALFTKFGPKGAGIFWVAAYGGCMLIPQALGKFRSGETNLLSKLGGLIFAIAGLLTPVLWAAVGVMLLLLMLGFSIWVYWNAEVRM